MYDLKFWVVAVLILCVVGLVMFAIGTRSKVNIGGDCEVDDHWFFGWWVRCVGGTRCPPSEVCTLLFRKKDSEEEWADTGIVPGGSIKWSKRMEYKCVCR